MPTTKKGILLGTDGLSAVQVDVLAESLNRVCKKMVSKIRSAAVIVGPNGQGPWQIRKLRGSISEFANRGCPVNPVILEDAPEVPELPFLLRQFAWVDFRKPQPDPWLRLVWGITGRRPN
jgi:hypothetical protein